MPHHLQIRPARNYPPPSSWNRAVYAALTVAIVAAGLLWRSGFIPLPQWLSNYGADALWALMLFVSFGFLLPRTSEGMIALLALTFSWAVEVARFYHAP